MKGGVGGGGGGGGGWSPIDRGERGGGQRNLKVILTSREGGRTPKKSGLTDGSLHSPAFDRGLKSLKSTV